MIMTATACTALSTAIHEAGHLIAQLATPGMPYMEGAWIERQSAGWAGMVETTAAWQPINVAMYEGASFSSNEDRAVVRDHLTLMAAADCIGYLAAPIAEIRWRRRGRVHAQFLGYDYRDACFSADNAPGSDLHRVRARIDWLNPPEPGAYFIEAWMKSEALLAHYWRDVVTLGRMLKRSKRLTDEQIYSWWTERIG